MAIRPFGALALSALLALCISGPSAAYPVDNVLREVDYQTAGDRAITKDTLTGRYWLDLSVTKDRYTHAELVGAANNCNPTCTTGELQGWTFATMADVLQLFTNSGLPPPDPFFEGCLKIWSPGGDPPVPAPQAFLDCANNLATFMTTVGTTLHGDVLRQIGGPDLTVDEIFMVQEESLGYSFDQRHLGAIMVPHCGCLGTGIDDSFEDRQNQLGVWLFRVPEPSSLALMSLGLLPLLMRRRPSPKSGD